MIAGNRGKSGQHRVRWSLTATVRKDRESTTETYTAVRPERRQLNDFLCSLAHRRASHREIAHLVPLRTHGKGEKCEVRAHGIL